MEDSTRGTLDAKLDILESLHVDRREQMRKIEGINFICARLDNSREFSGDEVELMVQALVALQRELQDNKERIDQEVQTGILEISDLMYYEPTQMGRAEVLQAYAEWYHRQRVQEENVAHLNRAEHTRYHMEEDETRNQDDLPF